MAVLVLAGPPAAGHNVIAELICASRTRAALIDVDDVRRLQRVPYASPWEGAEGERQYSLGIRNACGLARHFDADGSDVVLVDVAPPQKLPLYREGLCSTDRLSIVLLHAEADVLIERDTPAADRAASKRRLGTIASGSCATTSSRRRLRPHSRHGHYLSRAVSREARRPARFVSSREE